MSYLPENLYKELLLLTNCKKFFVAYSGGIDSQVLLYSLAQLRTDHSDIEITAVHVNHSLSTNSEAWVEFCRQTCSFLDITLLVNKVDIAAEIKLVSGKQKPSMEAIARKARYQVFEKLLPENAVLLTAHHADDQAETVLLQLLRGSGPKGLAAIAPHKKFAQGELIRPLLKFSRADLLHYAKENKLQWVEDESNLDLSIDRNYVRHKLIPLLNENWSSSGVIKTLARVAQNCVEASHLVNILALQDNVTVQGSVKNTLSVTKLNALDCYRQRNVIRNWIDELQLPTPSSVKLDQIQKTILQCDSTANPLVHWHGAEIRRFKDNIYAMPNLTKHDPSIILQWNLLEPLILPNDLGILHAKDLGFSLENNKPPLNITVRFRQGGETLRIKSRGNHSFTLKNLFQEWQVPPWLRNRIPLIYQNDELIVVVGYSCFSDI